MKWQSVLKKSFFLFVFVFTAFVCSLYAQTKDSEPDAVRHHARYIDANGDGICDIQDKMETVHPKGGPHAKNGIEVGHGMKHGIDAGFCNGTEGLGGIGRKGKGQRH
ncbi:MAG: hypothetical protein Q8903_13210 [Bacteroidota bacterium]|nr:hypothetical protein [Bacteroidota bacterium]